MELILIENVDNLGLRGDVVSVKNGYARNYLLPKGLAIEATPGNVKQIEQQRTKIEALKVKERADAEELKTKLEEVELQIIKNAGDKGVLFGSVTMQEIADLLLEKGFEIDKRKIATADAIKTGGNFEIQIKVFPEVSAVLNLRVYTTQEWEELQEEKAKAEEEAAAAAEAEAAEAETADETETTEEPAEEAAPAEETEAPVEETASEEEETTEEPEKEAKPEEEAEEEKTGETEEEPEEEEKKEDE